MIVNVCPAWGANELSVDSVSVPFNVAAPLTFSWSYPTPAVVPPISMGSEPPAPCAYEPVIASAPGENPGDTVPAGFETAAATVPAPESVPPFSVTLEAPMAELGPTTREPVLDSAFGSVSVLPPVTVSEPGFVVKSRNPSFPDVSWMDAEDPLRVIVDWFVTMSAPVNFRMPETLNVPPVRTSVAWL